MMNMIKLIFLIFMVNSCVSSNKSEQSEFLLFDSNNVELAKGKTRTGESFYSNWEYHVDKSNFNLTWSKIKTQNFEYPIPKAWNLITDSTVIFNYYGSVYKDSVQVLLAKFNLTESGSKMNLRTYFNNGKNIMLSEYKTVQELELKIEDPHFAFGFLKLTKKSDFNLYCMNFLIQNGENVYDILYYYIPNSNQSNAELHKIILLQICAGLKLENKNIVSIKNANVMINSKIDNYIQKNSEKTDYF